MFSLVRGGVRYSSSDPRGRVQARPHPTHPHLAQVLRWIDDLGVKQAALTHLDQSMDYVTLKAELPEQVEPAYDGLEFVW